MGRFMDLNRRLLVIDDDPDVAPPIEAIARRLRFSVMMRKDGFDFERVVDEFRPTIIFLDLALPGRDGLELVGCLVMNNYSGKLVVMSGWDVTQIQLVSRFASAQGLTVAGTLPKPFQIRVIVDLLTNAGLSRC
jgi:DNA-binding response OmpR family regulator